METPMLLAEPAPTAAENRRLVAFRWCPAWPAALIMALLIPTQFSFYIGSLRLAPYRVVLLVAFLPCLARLFSGQAGRLLATDLLVFGHLAWAYLAFTANHGLAVAVESGGIRMVEFGGAYLIARTAIVDEKSFRGVVALLITAICLLAPITLFESVSGIHPIQSIATQLTGGSFVSTIEDRLGMARAYGPFDHPILYGVFAASALGMARLPALPQVGHPRSTLTPQIAIVVATFTALSAGPMAALVTQLCLLAWDQLTRNVTWRWALFTVLVLLAYIAVDALSNRSGIKVFLSYLTFSAHTAYNRIIIFEWGIQNVWQHPLFGIGFNEWTRPSWMHSTSMDNFWLVQAVRLGIPGFLTISAAYLLMLSRRWRTLPDRLTRLRLGWAISMIGLTVSGCTVHFWNNLFVYFAFMLGAGAWFHQVHRRSLTRATEEGLL